MDKYFKNWDIRRIFYLLGGIFFMFTAFKDQIWWIGLFGLYFMSMAIFRFGCASGNCSVDFDKQPSKESSSHPSE